MQLPTITLLFGFLAACNAVCLVKEPLLLGEAGDEYCAIDGTAPEAEFQLSTYCSAEDSDVVTSMLSLQAKVFKVQPLNAGLCQQQLVGQLFWIPLDDFESQTPVNPVRGEKLLARYSLGEPTGADEEPVRSYCIVDMEDPLRPCVQFGSEMDIVNTTNTVEVLVERLPQKLEISNVQPATWFNITKINETLLLEGELRNLETVDQYIEDHFRFPIQKVTRLNMPGVLANYPTSYKKNGKELLAMDNDNQFLEASVQDVHVIHHLLAHSKITVTVRGTIVRSTYNTVATLKKIYDTKPLQSVEEQFYLSLTEGYITDIQVVYGEFIKIDLDPPPQDDEDNTSDSDLVEVDTNSGEPVVVELPTKPFPVPFQAAYPGFRPYFIAACFIFFGTVIIAACDVIRRSYKMRTSKSLKRQYMTMRRV